MAMEGSGMSAQPHVDRLHALTKLRMIELLEGDASNASICACLQKLIGDQTLLQNILLHDRHIARRARTTLNIVDMLMGLVLAVSVSVLIAKPPQALCMLPSH